MAHGPADLSHDVTRLKPVNKTLGLALMVIGLIAVLAAFVVAGGDHRRFWFAYLLGVAGVTTISSAALIFTMVNHLVRAGWITNVRRILESIAVQMPLVFVLMIPIVIVGLGRTGTLYSWSKPSDTPIAAEVHVKVDLASSLESYPNEQVQPGVTRAFDEGVAPQGAQLADSVVLGTPHFHLVRCHVGDGVVVLQPERQTGF